jgi:hypothetical protein
MRTDERPVAFFVDSKGVGFSLHAGDSLGAFRVVRISLRRETVWIDDGDGVREIRFPSASVSSESRGFMAVKASHFEIGGGAAADGHRKSSGPAAPSELRTVGEISSDRTDPAIAGNNDSGAPSELLPSAKARTASGQETSATGGTTPAQVQPGAAADDSDTLPAKPTADELFRVRYGDAAWERLLHQRMVQDIAAHGFPYARNDGGKP